MIALQEVSPQPQPRQVERGRTATRRRFRRAQRRGYAAFVRIGVLAAALALPLLTYVMLTANLTSLNYKLARVQAQRTDLLAQTMRQEDRIAKLESRERLAAIAARLNMHEPQAYAVVELSAPAPRVPAPSGGIALLGAMDHWLSVVAGGVRHP